LGGGETDAMIDGQLYRRLAKDQTDLDHWLKDDDENSPIEAKRSPLLKADGVTVAFAAQKDGSLRATYILARRDGHPAGGGPLSLGPPRPHF
jgi:hypothetical protein